MEGLSAPKCEWINSRGKVPAQSSWAWTIVVTLVVFVALAMMCFYFYHTSTSRTRSKDDHLSSTEGDDNDGTNNDTHVTNAEVGGGDPFFTPLQALKNKSAR